MKKKYFGIISWGMLLSSFAQAQEYNSAEVYQSAFNLVQEKYIHYQPEDIENMAINGLKALHNIDKNLSVADDEKRMSLYYKGRVVRSHLKPENRQNIKAWNKLTENMIKAAQNVSSRAKQNDFMILDTIMEEAVNQSLDGVSKYYPEGQSEAVVKSGAAKSFAAGLQDNILYIKISAFNDYTIKNLEKTWQENPNYEGIILDLRGSVGGELSEAMKVADMFLSGGIMVAESKADGKITYYHADEEDKTQDKPLVILVDGETMSAAELVASAMQAQSRGKLVGTTTFGKGSKQELYELPNGAVMGLTRGYFYTAGGEALDGNGVMPDICTYGTQEVANMEKFVNQKPQTICQSQGREKQEFDISVAKYIIESQL